MLARVRVLFKNWKLASVFTVTMGFCGGLGGIAGVASLFYSKEAQRTAAEALIISQKTYDREAGKVLAKLTVRGGDSQIPALLEFGKSGDAVRLTKPQHLQMMNPRMIVENTGDEPIEAIKLECKVRLFASKFFKSQPIDEFQALSNWRHETLIAEECPLIGKLNPGDRAVVPVSRVILNQMARVQDPTLPETNHHGIFEVRCHGRLVNATSFDPAVADANGIPVDLIWVPKGFTDEEVKRFLDSDKPMVQVIRRK